MENIKNATVADAERELLSAEKEMETFLLSVKGDDFFVQDEIQTFKEADWDKKSQLISNYRKEFKDVKLTPEQKTMLDNANMSVLIGRTINLGIPTSIIHEMPKVQKQPVQVVSPKATQQQVSRVENYYNSAVSKIMEIRKMKNFDKSVYQGRPLDEFFSKIQFKQNAFCSAKDFETIKQCGQGLERYNYAMSIISDLETKVFPPNYRNDFSYKIAQTLKSSKTATCSEKQLACLIRAKDKLIAVEDRQQIDFSTLMAMNEKGKVDKGEMSR